MALSVLFSRTSCGIDAPCVHVEVYISNGLPKFAIVGLPDAQIKESRDRIRSALLNMGFNFPYRRITVNLAPADLPKEGGRFDLPIALGILAASNQLPIQPLQDYEFAGELALTGKLRTFKGALPFALGARRDKRSLILPEHNAKEAALVDGISIFAANHLTDVCLHLTGTQTLEQIRSVKPISSDEHSLDLADVNGQFQARRALEIAASGQHSLLLTGPPGTGKTMLASRLPSILPDMSTDEALETAALLSLSQQGFDKARFYQRPFRAPHHTASSVALVGGSSPPKPGEISLSHNGVLFLDELPEYPRHVLDALREPLESGHITISRAARQAQFPAKFQLVCAMNPCPCGYASDPNKECRCTPEQIQRYQSRISGPLLDRIDLHVIVPPLPYSALFHDNDQQKLPENSANVKARVIRAREKQYQRQQTVNALLSTKTLLTHCKLNPQEQTVLAKAMEKWQLSARSYHRILRCARTIADLDNCDQIQKNHLIEALGYRLPLK